VQVLDLIISVHCVAKKVLTLSDLATELISQCIDLLFQALDALTVVLFSGFQLALGLELT
jgi:hypothetical protein